MRDAFFEIRQCDGNTVRVAPDLVTVIDRSKLTHDVTFDLQPDERANLTLADPNALAVAYKWQLQPAVKTTDDQDVSTLVATISPLPGLLKTFESIGSNAATMSRNAAPPLRTQCEEELISLGIAPRFVAAYANDVSSLLADAATTQRSYQDVSTCANTREAKKEVSTWDSDALKETTE